MKLNNRLTSGMAWAGLALVIGVPVADFALARVGQDSTLTVSETKTNTPAGAQTGSKPVVLQSANARPQVDPVVTASTASSATAKAERDTPDYISGDTPEVAAVQPLPRRPAQQVTEAEAPASRQASVESKPVVSEAAVPAPRQAAVESKPVVVDRSAAPTARETQTAVVESRPAAQETQTAAVEIRPATTQPQQPVTPVEDQPVLAAVGPQVELQAPIPLPRSARPAVSAGTVASLPQVSREGIVLPSDLRNEQAAISEEPIFEEEEPFIREEQSFADFVDAEELEDWESGPLTEFLEERRERDRPRRASRRTDDFDADGFFLDEGPNDRPRRGAFNPFEN